MASRPDAYAGKHIGERGAGTGLPGIVAASLGAQVVQTDRHALALSRCKRNGERNRAHRIAYRLADGTNGNDRTRYDLMLGADMRYGAARHPHLRYIFAANLAAGGRVLLADPFRAVSFWLLETRETEGWTITWNKWSIGEAAALRSIGVFVLVRPTQR